MPIEPKSSQQDIKRVPESAEVRQAIRGAANRISFEGTPTFERLRELAVGLLERENLPLDYLGFAMVALSNAWWADAFASVPFDKRLLVLPQCLRSSASCSASFNSNGLICSHCALCPISDIQSRAEQLGYGVAVAEGVTSVTMYAIEGQADAILGVACLDSLEKSHGRISDWGIPHLAVPLLTDGCKDTEADLDELNRFLNLSQDRPSKSYASYVPLLRFANRLFESKWIDGGSDADRIAHQWLAIGGKRFRPFVTLASYAVRKHGMGVLDSQTVLEPLIPEAVKRLAVAVEAMHKASLAHDDIQDGDLMRYGHETLHRAHGVPIAINTGDYLVGLGYDIIASCAEELGPQAVADMLGRMSSAHLELCRGQGQELQWTRERPESLSPLETLRCYRQKTAPAFTTALYVGLRAAGPVEFTDELNRFGNYVGEAYQVLNDLDDWEDADNKGSVGLDARAMRPTVLLAFALESGAGPAIKKALCDPKSGAAIGELAAVYQQCGALQKAESLYVKLRQRAIACAETCQEPALRPLLVFLARVVLPDKRLA